MEFSVKAGSPEKQKSACLIVGIFENKHQSNAAKLLDSASNKQISNILKRGDISGKSGETVLLHNVPGIAAERVLLVGCGKEKEFNRKNYLAALGCAVKQLSATSIKEAACYLTELDVIDMDAHKKTKCAVELTDATIYLYTQTKPSAKDKISKLAKFSFCFSTDNDLSQAKKGLVQGKAVANGVKLAKELGDLPGNICTPGYLASQAKTLSKKFKSIKTSVLEEKDMAKLGMGALLSVSKGSTEPAKLIAMQYNGTTASKHPVVLVGKGVTFDSGGISLKPGAMMDEMKYDMCGAASVLGTIQACAEMKLPINVVGVIPTTENLPDGKASKPGDIVTSMSGQTIEILNTDAEGRLILCDALTYVKKFKPDVVIDIATLTGACVVALGRHACGMLSNDDKLSDDILQAGTESGDRAWRMPLWEEYDKQLDSNFADMGNIGGKEAGTITAACFLSRYTKDYTWAHLDVAGTAWISGGSEKGATGRPVPLLTQFIINKCK